MSAPRLLPSDWARLGRQKRDVLSALAQGGAAFRTLRELAVITGHPEASISARLRELRNDGFAVNSVNLGDGLWRYGLTSTERAAPRTARRNLNAEVKSLRDENLRLKEKLAKYEGHPWFQLLIGNENIEVAT